MSNLSSQTIVFVNIWSIGACVVNLPIGSSPSVLFFLSSFQHKDAYQVILDGVKGGTKEKRLAAQFIPKFFKHFPELADSAINAQLDLCEDEDVSVSL